MAVGFTARQIEVYVALLQLGRGTVSQIARAAGINRTTGYDILDSLVEKGLVSISGREPKQEYVAELPERLMEYLRQESARASAHVRAVEKLIPELASIHNVAGRPKVMFYEGKDGLERVYEDTLTSSETILAYANVEDMHKALPNYFPKYYQRRAGKGISIRAILPANPAGEERAGHDSEESREAALVPTDKYFFSPEINIYDDKIMIASWREKLGIIIQSQEIAEAMKSIYKLAWAEAKRVDVRRAGSDKKDTSGDNAVQSDQ
jgi:sugar-specific transcriptional regulator TrmB